MSRVGKNAAASIAAIICIVFVANILLPLSVAQSAGDTTRPVTVANVSGTLGDNGWYISNVSIKLTATDTGSGVSYTQYKVDSGSYVNYTPDISLYDGAHTVFFYSVDKSGNTEVAKSINVNVDTQKPLLNVLVKGNMTGAGWYNGTATVNFTSSDNGSGPNSNFYFLDGGSSTQYTGNVTLGDGNHTITFACYDKAGNLNTTTTSVDVFDPAISVTYNNTAYPGTVAYNNDLTVYLAKPSGETRVDHLEYMLDGKNWISGTSFQLTGDGNHQFFYRAVDTSGYPGNSHMNWTLIDKNGPTISISIDGDMSSKGWYNGDIYVTLNVKNDASTVKTEYYWNGKWNNYTSKFKINWQRSGEIKFHTTDIFGNTTPDGSKFIYFAPASYNQGAMSNSIYLNGITYGPSTGDQGSSGSDNPVTTPRPTRVPSPMPALIPSPSPESTDTSSGSDSPLAIAVLIGVLAVIAIAAAAYFFIRKPK